MKICIPTQTDLGLDAEPNAHFGRAPFLTVVDLDHDQVTSIRNPACHKKEGRCHHVPVLNAHGVKAVVCPRMGRRARADLEAAGIAVYASPEAPVARMVEAFRAGELSPAAASAGGHEGTCRGHR